MALSHADFAWERTWPASRGGASMRGGLDCAPNGRRCTASVIPQHRPRNRHQTASTDATIDRRFHIVMSPRIVASEVRGGSLARRHMVARPERDLLRRRNCRASTVLILSQPAALMASSDERPMESSIAQPPSTKSVCRDAHAHSACRAATRRAPPRYLQRKADAIVDGPPYASSRGSQRREELAWNRYPWAPGNRSRPMPRRAARREASTKSR